jgi:REP element-mobilizing transposase RayT
MAGTAKNLDSRCLVVGGTENHIHALVSQSKKVALCHLMEEIKKSSSKWIKTRGSAFQAFAWQDGYGAFTVGQSQVKAVKVYIGGQKERHKRQSFEQEFEALLEKYGVQFDERYLWS